MLLILISAALAFLTTFIITPYFMKFFKNIGLVGLDVHKKGKPKLPTSGGIPVALGLLFSLLFFIAVQTFVYEASIQLLYLLAACSSILIITFVGLLDDLNIKKKKVEVKRGEKDIRVGLKQWLKPLMTFPAAVPLMAVKAGTTTMAIPLIGEMNFGIFYPLIIIPIGVVGASNMVNLLGGFNGVEAGMGVVYTTSLGIYAFLHGSIAASAILLSCSGALLAFLFFNFYPAKILPGDSLTYLLGAIVASSVIIGNMERTGIIVMLPFIVEFFLKARSRFKASCLGKLRKDGKLNPPYGKNMYSWTHIIMNLKPLTEKQVTIGLIGIQIFFAVLPFLKF
jgi:UDP-N-acetylglucosamine--dolichyl-phosphate N-acetylglucosaminephosphotransferase